MLTKTCNIVEVFSSHILPLADVQCSLLQVASAGSQAQSCLLLSEAHTHQLGHFLWVQTQATVEVFNLAALVGKEGDQIKSKTQGNN